MLTPKLGGDRPRPKTFVVPPLSESLESDTKSSTPERGGLLASPARLVGGDIHEEEEEEDDESEEEEEQVGEASDPLCTRVVVGS